MDTLHFAYICVRLDKKADYANVCRKIKSTDAKQVLEAFCACYYNIRMLMLICTVHPFQMVVKGCTGQLSDGEKNIQCMFLPQPLNYQRFFCRRRSFSKTKACKFFR